MSTENLKEPVAAALQSPRSRRFRSALVVSKIALAMVLLIGAGLMVRTLAGLSRVKPRLQPMDVLNVTRPAFRER